jgi:hypothetical protein
MPTYTVSFVNRFGFRVITYHYSASDAALRLQELERWYGIRGTVAEL